MPAPVPAVLRVPRVTMSELKLRRLTENNNRLRQDLERPRLLVSLVSLSLINYCRQTTDPLLPSVWGPVPKGADPYSPVEGGSCCTVM